MANLRRIGLAVLIVLGGSTVAWSAPLTHYLDFDGVNDWVEVTGAGPNLTGTQMTIEAWLTGRDLTSFQTAASKTEGGAYGVSITHPWFTSKHVGFIVNNNFGGTSGYHFAQSTDALEQDRWYHVAGTYDATGATDAVLKLYIDGELDSTTIIAGGAGKTIKPSSVPFVIGAEPGSGSNRYQHFDGRIDEVRLWNVARTGTEISDNRNESLSGTEAGLVGYWRLNAPGPVAIDSAGGDDPGQLGSTAGADANDPTWLRGGRAHDAENAPYLEFDGGDYVRIPYHADLNMNGHNAITVEAWFRSDDVAKNQRILSRTEGGAYQLTISHPTSGGDSFAKKGVFLIHAGGAYRFLETTAELEDGKWYHMAGTFDGSNTRLYLNGVLQETVPASGTIQGSGTSVPLFIGTEAAGSNPGSEYFLGGIDEVRIWDICRSAGDIQGAMYSQVDPSITGLVGYWRLDDNSGQWAIDYTGHGHDGVLGSGTTVDAHDPTWILAPEPGSLSLVAFGLTALARRRRRR